MTKILLNMNQEEFQKQLFKLEKQEQINSAKNQLLENLYSFRFSQKYRGTAYREGDYMVLVGLFPNHDGAYK